MGAVFGGQQGNASTVRTIPPKDQWLQNQTFKVKNQLYTLIEHRGGGTFGSVWASTTPHGQYAAVKAFDMRSLPMNMNIPSVAKSFQREVEMIYRMRAERQYVVTVYGFDFDATRRVALLAMELGGESLKDRAMSLHQMTLSSPNSGDEFISAADRKNLWIQLVNIIIALRRHKIVHRDLKPDNLVFFGPLMKVVDLGIAQKEIARFSNQPIVAGTQFYSAPECLSGQHPVTSKADIWSAGAILYFLTYGHPPVYGSAHPPSNLPQTRSSLVQHILQYSLQADPHRRATHRFLDQHPFTRTPAVY